MKKILWILIAIFCTSAVLAQEDDMEMQRALIIEQRIEQIAETAEDENLDYNTLFEQLSVYLDFPLNLNTATANDLYGLGFLTSYQIGQFMEYRNEFGNFFSIYELALINGWDAHIAEIIEPFITVSAEVSQPKITLKRMLRYGKNEWIVRYQRILEEQHGYTEATEEEWERNPNARYLGSPDKIYTRYRYRYSDRISFGVTAEKDNGEEFFKGSQKQGFDFYSAHLYLKNFGRVKSFAVGDFQAQFGQGLTFWSGLGFNRKSSFSTSTIQRGRGITPYTSVNENLFLRGIATTVKIDERFDISLFYSGKGIDGNIDSARDSLDLEEQELVVSSFQESGFHRTASEVANKKAIFQQHYGGNISFNHNRLHIGITAAHMKLDGSIKRKHVEYSKFRFNGSENTVIGGDYTFNIRNFFFFGETTFSANGAVATVNGVNMALNPRLSINVTQRHYDYDFQEVASIGFGEGSRVENESGVYLGAELRPFKKWVFNTYFDQFKFPWMRYQVDAPSSGYDFLAQLEYEPSYRFGFYIRYRDRNKQINSRADTEGIRTLVDNPRKNLRLNFTYSVSRQLNFTSRIEFSEYRRGTEPKANGFMVFQNVSYDFKNTPLRLVARYAIFDTDSYDARIYAYENDVLYSFTIPAYSGRGTRVYAMARYKMNRRLSFWLRWSQFYYTDRHEISSGKERIDGNTKSEIKAQMIYKF